LAQYLFRLLVSSSFGLSVFTCLLMSLNTQADEKPVSASQTLSLTPSSSTSIDKSQPKLPNEILFPIPLLNTPQKIATRYPVGHAYSFVPEFEDYVAEKIAPNVPGVAIVIVAGGEIQSMRTWGVKQFGSNDYLTPDSVFRLASVSKTLASTAAAILVNQGKIRWDTTVLSLLPGVKFKNNRYGQLLTLKHILSQSTGLPTHASTSLIEADKSYDEAVKRLRYSRFVCAPGQCYAYQNITYSLAGDMLAKKTGQNFEQFVKQYLFNPLGMKSASYGLNGYLRSPNRALPHVRWKKSWGRADVTENYYRIAPAAGANASIADMSQFLLAQLGTRPDILPGLVLNQLHARITKNTPAQNHYAKQRAVYNTAYGLGWRVFDYGSHKNFVHHGGWVKGFRSEVIFNRDLQIGMVFLTNSETRLARDVIFKFMDMHERAYNAAHLTKK
jgi:beta-lactamase class C